MLVMVAITFLLQVLLCHYQNTPINRTVCISLGVMTVTCKDCVNHDDCERESKTSPCKAHTMWIIDFWENAEKRCRKFKPTDGESR